MLDDQQRYCAEVDDDDEPRVGEQRCPDTGDPIAGGEEFFAHQPRQNDPQHNRLSDPRDHAVQTQEADFVNGVFEQPHEEEPRSEHADGEGSPEPTSKSRPSEHARTDGGDDTPTDEPPEIVGDAQECARFVRLHDVATGKERVDVARRLCAVLEEVVTLGGQRQRGREGQQTEHEQKCAENATSAEVWVHDSIIAVPS